MNKLTRPLVFTALVCGLATSCGGSDTPAGTTGPASASAEIREDIYLRFTIDGDGFSNGEIPYKEIPGLTQSRPCWRKSEKVS